MSISAFMPESGKVKKIRRANLIVTLSDMNVCFIPFQILTCQLVCFSNTIGIIVGVLVTAIVVVVIIVVVSCFCCSCCLLAKHRNRRGNTSYSEYSHK